MASITSVLISMVQTLQDIVLTPLVPQVTGVVITPSFSECPFAGIVYSVVSLHIVQVDILCPGSVQVGSLSVFPASHVWPIAGIPARNNTSPQFVHCSSIVPGSIHVAFSVITFCISVCLQGSSHDVASKMIERISKIMTL